LLEEAVRRRGVVLARGVERAAIDQPAN
jgi:hypothetical protein